MTGYTSLQTLGGLDQPEKDGAGENFMQSLVGSYPHGPVAIGVFLVGALDAVNAGSLAGAIDAPGTKRAALGRAVLLRIGHAFDNPASGYAAAGYRSAFARIAARERRLVSARLGDNGSFGDSRVQADPTILASWRTALADPRWANP